MKKQLFLFFLILFILLQITSAVICAETYSPVFPGRFFIVDRSSLYDDNHNELGNGGFELETNGTPDYWEIDVLSGSPKTTVVHREDGQGRAFQVTALEEDDFILLKSESILISSRAERFYIAFKVKTDFAVIDREWETGIRLFAQWTLSDGNYITEDVTRVTHSFYSWQPFFVDTSVPANAVSLQLGLEIGGLVPNTTTSHTLWVDDILLFPEPSALSPVPVQGRITKEIDNILHFSGKAEGRCGEYAVTAIFKPFINSISGEGEVSGEISKGPGCDIPVDIIYAIKIDADRGRIYYDISRKEEVTEEKDIYEDPYSADFYSTLTMSRLPLNSLTTTTGSSLSLAVSLDSPGIFLFRYDNALKRFGIIYPLGLKSGDKYGATAFKHYIMRSETGSLEKSDTAYREFWQRYTDEIERHHFLSKRSVPRPVGSQLSALFDNSDMDISPLLPDLAGLLKDFGIQWAQNPLISPLPDRMFEQVESYDLELLNYDYPWIFEKRMSESTEPPPSYDEIDFVVKETAGSDGDTTFKKLETIQAQQVLHDARGDMLVNRVYSPDFALGNWLIRLPVQTGPLLSPYFETIMSEKYIPAFTEGDTTTLTSKPRINGIVFDGFMKESKVLNCSEENTAIAPFIYNPNDGTICSYIPVANVEYIRVIRREFDKSGLEDKVMAGNLNQLGPALFGMPFLDTAVWEATPLSGTNFGYSEMNARRMMFSHKKIGVIDKTDWCALPETHIRRFIETVALLGIYPNLMNFITPPECLLETDRQLEIRKILSEIIPVLDDMNEGQWQIIPHARIKDAIATETSMESLRIERFGQRPPYFFTVLNNPDGLLDESTAQGRNVTLSIDLNALESVDSPVVEIAYGEIEPVAVEVKDTGLEINFYLNPLYGAIFKINNKQ